MRDIDDVVSNERLKKLSEYDCADRYEVMSMATELLALRKEREKAEPVAWMLTDNEFGHSVATKAGFTLNFYRSKGWGVTPLYTAPPAPVVPDDDQSRQAYENHVRSRYQYPMLERHPEDGSTWQGEYKESAGQMEWEDWQCSWNACRAAMLNQK